MLLNQSQNTTFRLAIIMLFLFLPFTVLFGGSATVSWDPNSESDLGGYKIYYGTVSRTYSEVIDVGNVTSYTVNNLGSGQTYFFAVTAYDVSGNESGFSAEVSATIAPSGGNPNTNPPALLAAVVMGETQIDVLFSEPLESNSAQNSSNYSIDNGVQVLGAVIDPNLTTVHLITTAHERGKSYVLSVSNVKDQDGNPIAPGSSISYDLPDPSGDTQPPELVYVVILDATHLDVIFSEPVERGSAENTGNYSIDNNVQVLQARLKDNQTVVQLITTEHQGGMTYTLTVNNIIDLATNPNEIQQNSTFSYRLNATGGGDNTPPELVSVTVNGPTQVDVNFSEPVEKSSAETKSNYSITPDIEIMGAVLDDNLTTVHLITSAHQNGVEYTLTVNNIKDRAESPATIAANSKKSYTYNSNEDSPEEPDDTEDTTPSSFVLFQNNPNPFNPETEIRFFLGKAHDVELKVYNTLGQLVKSLVKDSMSPGFHSVVWDGTNNDGFHVPSGVYIYTLEVKRNVQKGDLLVNVALERRVKKMTLIR
ncbi:MAG: FlgD immunoglobulin-like domain containing protein [bacterium]